VDLFIETSLGYINTTNGPRDFSSPNNPHTQTHFTLSLHTPSLSTCLPETLFAATRSAPDIFAVLESVAWSLKLAFFFFQQATISNPNTSQAAKEHSRQVLRELEGQGGTDTDPSHQTSSDGGVEEVVIETDRSNVTGDNVHHEGVLDDTGPAVDDSSFVGKEPNRVLGGFKAALHSECSLPS